MIGRRTLLCFVPLLSLAAAPNARAATRIPPQFLGEWDESAQGCVEGDWSSHLIIRARTIEPYESQGRVKTIKFQGPNAITTVSRYTFAEGSEIGTDRFTLSPSRKTLMWFTDGHSARLIRCPAK